MDLELEGKTVLITGASRGIGRAIALAFAREKAKVVISGRTKQDVEKTFDEVKRIGGEGHSYVFVGDLQREDQIVACIESVVQYWGRIDILVANVGSGAGEPGWKIDPAEWERLFDLNLHSGVRAARAVLPHMVKTESGNIVFISSIAGIEHLGAPLPYEAAKASLMAYAKSLSRTVAKQGIRVNVVAPGNILFPGSTWDDKLKTDEERMMKKIRQEVPMQRFGRPEEVADAVVFLSSSKATFITGSCLVVDGGQTRSFS